MTDTATETLNPAKLLGFPPPQNGSTSSPESQLPPIREVHRVPEKRPRPRELAYRFATQLVFTDWIVALAAIYVALTFREWQRTGWANVLHSRPEADPNVFLWSLGGSILFSWLMVMLRTYEVSNLYRLQRVLKNVVKASLLYATVAWACVGFFEIKGYNPRVGTVYSLLTLGGGFALWRLLCFVYLIQPRVKEAASTRVIVVGWNAQAANLRRHMRSDLGQLSEIIGCIPMPGGHFRTPPPVDIPVLGDYSALPELARQCQADSIILADVSCSAAEIHNLIAFCQRG